jgi:ATP-dependent exoDNAse (exonuclease V) beta subunit
MEINMSKKVELTLEQQEAINEIDKNLQIIACAGSGKTEVITRRIANILKTKTDITPKNIVAFTFTEKAAAEIKTRFIFKLQKLVQTIKLQREAKQKRDKNEPLTSEEENAVKESDKTLDLLRGYFTERAPEVAHEPLEKRQEKLEEVWVSRAETALARLDRSAIGTIHGFCADILKAFPLEAGLTPNAEIDSGQKGERLFEGAYYTVKIEKGKITDITT